MDREGTPHQWGVIYPRHKGQQIMCNDLDYLFESVTDVDV
jgi:hypothetical protein